MKTFRRQIIFFILVFICFFISGLVLILSIDQKQACILDSDIFMDQFSDFSLKFFGVLLLISMKTQISNVAILRD